MRNIRTQPAAFERVATTGSKESIPRNQKACDVCRSRKTKCSYDVDDTKCQGCISLGVECTANRPRKRRGPKARLASQNSAGSLRTVQVSTSNTHNPNTQDSTPSHQSHQSCPSHAPSPYHEVSGPTSNRLLSAFAPTDLIHRMLRDWFDRIHPVAPILLRRRFLRRLSSGEADINPTFCALVVSVCAATRATLPCEDYGHITVPGCVDYIDGNQLLTKSRIQSSYSLDWCIAMYNLGNAFYSNSKIGLTDVRSYHAFSEATAGVRYLLYYRKAELDEGERQLLQRLFWLLFAGSCTADILGRLPISIIAQDQLDSVARPLEKNDETLDPATGPEAGDQEWHGDYTSYVPGLNCLSNLYLVWQEARSTNNAQSVDLYLRKLQTVMDNFPPELRWRGGLSRPSHVTYGHDVQVANLFVTSLHIRSNLIQRFGTPEIKLREQPKIIDDLLEVLYHLPQAVFDANGRSLVPKIRDIGAAYLEQIRLSVPCHGNDESEAKLMRLLQKLDELDHQQVVD